MAIKDQDVDETSNQITEDPAMISVLGISVVVVLMLGCPLAGCLGALFIGERYGIGDSHLGFCMAMGSIPGVALGIIGTGLWSWLVRMRYFGCVLTVVWLGISFAVGAIWLASYLRVVCSSFDDLPSLRY
jgi:hypothetical protein